MIRKKIGIRFADPRITITEDISREVRDSIQKVSHNLYVRHHIDILHISKASSETFLVVMDIPDEKAENFNPGNHLRGISGVLLKARPDFYKQYLIGRRLLQYWEI